MNAYLKLAMGKDKNIVKKHKKLLIQLLRDPLN